MLSSYGFEISEAELRILCDCTPLGTDPLPSVDAARKLGFSDTRVYTLTLDQLAVLVKDEIYPYVEVNMGPIDGVKTAHALVVLAVDEETVTVHDPWQEKGERILPVNNFVAAWKMRSNMAVIVIKPERREQS